MLIDSGRLTNPVELDTAEAGRLIAGHNLSVIQFSSAPANPGLLAAINTLCREHGATLQVRFYGFYGEKLDASLLSDLPDVASLAVDCLEEIRNISALADLSRLERLSLGVSGLNLPNVLDLLRLEYLKHLSLGPTRTNNINLAPLRRCAVLQQLHIHGHARNADAIAAIPNLDALTLGSFPKKVPLNFLNDAASLKQLCLLLGSRESIAELTHPGIERLGLCWVRGLSDLGPLHRFSALCELSVEDQARLTTLKLEGSRLERLRLVNCKSLASVEGLEKLETLRELLVSRTALDLEVLRDRQWQPTMEAIGLFSGSNRWNNAARETLAERGFAQSGKPWLWP